MKESIGNLHFIETKFLPYEVRDWEKIFSEEISDKELNIQRILKTQQ